MTEDEMFGWHHRLDGHEFEQALGVGDGQGSLVCHRKKGKKVGGYYSVIKRRKSCHLQQHGWISRALC